MPALPDRTAAPRMSDYEEEKAGFRLEVPEVFNPVLDIVETWAAEAPWSSRAWWTTRPSGPTRASR